MAPTYLKFLLVFMFFVPQARASVPDSSQTLAETICLEEAGERAFVLTQEAIEPQQKRSVFLRLITFRLERIPVSSAGAPELIWQAETSHLSGVPWPLWSASIVCDPTGEEIYIVLSYSRGVVDMALDIYCIPATAPAIQADRQISPKDTPLTPALREKPLLSYRGDLRYDSGGVKAIEGCLAGKIIKVTMFLRNDRLDPVYFEIDLETKEIRRVPEDPRAKGETPP